MLNRLLTLLLLQYVYMAKKDTTLPTLKWSSVWGLVTSCGVVAYCNQLNTPYLTLWLAKVSHTSPEWPLLEVLQYLFICCITNRRNSQKKMLDLFTAISNRTFPTAVVSH